MSLLKLALRLAAGSFAAATLAPPPRQLLAMAAAMRCGPASRGPTAFSRRARPV